MRQLFRSCTISGSALALLLAAGCGLKGELFLPPEPATPEPVAEPEPPAAEDEEEDRGDDNEDG